MASASAALAPAAASGPTRGAPRPGAALPRRAASAGPGSAVGRASRLRLGGRPPRASAIADGPDGSRAGPGPGPGPAGPRSSPPPAGVDRGAGAPASTTSSTSSSSSSSRKAEKRAIHAARHPGGHDPEVSLGYNARRLARRGDARAALKLLRKGIRRHPTNAHFRVAAAQLIAADADGAAEGDEAYALDRAAAFLDAFVGARDGFDFAGGEETSKERGGEPPRSSSSSSPRDPPAGGGGELSVRSRSAVLAARASLDARRLRRRRARRPGGKNDESGTDASALRAPPPATAASTRAFFARACAADPSHAAAFHAWASFERFMGRVHKARRLYRECAKIHPPRAATLQAWGAMEADPANPEGANPEAARRLFREALALDPGHAPTHVAWALMEQRLGMHARASKLFQRGEASTRALKGSARRAPRENGGGGGVSLVFFDDRARARSALLAAWAAHEARFNAPRSEKAARRARALFREACDAEPENARAWASWAKAEGEFRFPISELRFPQTPPSGEERDPRDEEASSSASSSGSSEAGSSSGATTTALLESSAFGRRLAVLEEGLARCPGNFFLRHARASSLARLGRLEEARDALESLTRERPESPLAWHALGWTLRELGAFENAVDAFVTGARAAGGIGGERGNGSEGRGGEGGEGRSSGFSGRGSGAAAKVGGNHSALNLPCLTAAASTAMHRGDEARARALFMEGSGVASTPPPAAASSSSSSSSVGASSARDRAAHLRLWATLEKRAGKTSVARALFQRAADADPTDASTWTQWGQFERRASGMDAARATFAAGARRAKPGRGARSRAFLYHAWAAAELSAGEGSRTLARDALERGVAAHPNHAPLWIELGELKLAEGEDAEARVALERGGLDRKAIERRVSEMARLREEGNANFASANFANANANALDDFSILGGGPLDGALPEGAEVGGPPGGAEEVVVRKRRDKASSGSGGVSDEDEDVSSSASASSSSSYAAAAKEAAVEAAMERERERERAEAALEEGLRSVDSVRSWWEENESIWRF